MKFRASLTDRGAQSLTKAFLPTLEKFGKSCVVLLGEEEIHFVQTEADTDGAHVSVRFQPDVLFQAANLRLQSRHHNLIGVGVDLGMLLKALRSAAANDADSLEVKLTQKPVQLPGGDGESENKPFLCFTSRGAALSLVQDLPISKPCTPGEIDSLIARSRGPELCPFYLDLQSAGGRLSAVVDRMKALSSTVQVALCKTGDLHIQVAEANIMLGAQFEGLGVFPLDVRAAPDAVNRAQTAEEQLQAALDSGNGVAVHIQVKHLLKVINVANLSQPSQILFGIPEGCGHVHVMYVYRDPSGDAPYDDSIGVNFKLPVRDED